MMMPVRRPPPAQQPGDGPLQPLLGDRVEPRGRFVEDDQAGIFKQQAGEGEQLRFARRHPRAARRQARVEALRHRRPANRAGPARRARRVIRSSLMAGSKKAMLSRRLALKSCTSCVTMPTRARRSSSPTSRRSHVAQPDGPGGRGRRGGTAGG